MCNCLLSTIEKSRASEKGGKKPYEPKEYEHIANILSHAILIIPSLWGLYWMLSSTSGAKMWLICSLYGGSMFALFSVSTLFHLLAYYSPRENKLRYILHLCDRGVIYIFIAASYTPWLALKEYNINPNFMLVLVWSAAFLGIVYQCTYHERYKCLEIVFYLSLGVMPAIITMEMKNTSGVSEMALGGALYVSGVLFFKLDGHLPCAHAIWHCFVSLGAYIHYRAVCNYLLINDLS